MDRLLDLLGGVAGILIPHQPSLTGVMVGDLPFHPGVPDHFHQLEMEVSWRCRVPRHAGWDFHEV